MESKESLEKIRIEYYAYHESIYSEFSTGSYEDDYVTFLESKIEELGKELQPTSK